MACSKMGLRKLFQRKPHGIALATPAFKSVGIGFAVL